MSKLTRTSIVLLTAIFVGGCANSNIKPVHILCPLIGGVAGAGVGAGVFSDDSGAGIAATALVGAVVGHFVCGEG